MAERSKVPSSFVLIDDDPLIQATWSMVAKTKGHTVRCFSTLDEFDQANINTQTPIFIDYHLKNQTGTEAAKSLTQKGHQEIYLTTGTHPDHIPPTLEIKKILGKDYPF